MQMTPVIAIHLSAALAATALGPIAIWARLRRSVHPRLHRAVGYAWVTLMLATALSAAFIRSTTIINLNGYTPIHLLIPVVFGMLFAAFVALARGNIKLHRRLMVGVYIGGCVVAGAFTLLPNRYLGQLVWGEWLGLLDPSATGLTSMRTPWEWILASVIVVWGLARLRRRIESASTTSTATRPV